MVAIVLVQTNFGSGHVISYRNDVCLPPVQATGGKVFDLKSVESTLPEHSVVDSTRKS